MLAQDFTINAGWIALFAAIVTIGLGLIKLLDRLYLEPLKERKSPKPVEQAPQCRFDHDQITSSAERMEIAIAKMAENQGALASAITAMTKEGEHQREIAKMRHHEVMKSLELLERKMISNQGH